MKNKCLNNESPFKKYVSFGFIFVFVLILLSGCSRGESEEEILARERFDEIRAVFSEFHITSQNVESYAIGIFDALIQIGDHIDRETRNTNTARYIISIYELPWDDDNFPTSNSALNNLLNDSSYVFNSFEDAVVLFRESSTYKDQYDDFNNDRLSLNIMRDNVINHPDDFDEVFSIAGQLLDYFDDINRLIHQNNPSFEYLTTERNRIMNAVRVLISNLRNHLNNL